MYLHGLDVKMSAGEDGVGLLQRLPKRTCTGNLQPKTEFLYFAMRRQATYKK